MVVVNQMCASAVEHRAVEVDLVPAEVADLGSPQPVSVGEEDHRRVTMAVAVFPGGRKQGLDLAGGQVLAGPQIGVLLPLRSNCSFYFGWRDQLKVGFCHVKSMPPHVDCS
jgi:hypothetical protein